MQEIFIKAVTAPDDSRDIILYETYYNGITEIFACLDGAEKELLRQVDLEIYDQLSKLESACFYELPDKYRVCHNSNIITLIKRKVEIKKQVSAVMDKDC